MGDISMESSMERGEGCSSLAGKSFGSPVPYFKLAEASFPDAPSLPALGEKGGGAFHSTPPSVPPRNALNPSNFRGPNLPPRGKDIIGLWPEALRSLGGRILWSLSPSLNYTSDGKLSLLERVDLIFGNGQKSSRAESIKQRK